MTKRLLIFVLAAAATVFGAIAMSQASTPEARPAKHARPGHRTYTVSPVLTHRFAVLRTARAATAWTAPAEYAEHLTEPGTMVSEYQLEPTQARAITVGGTQVWVTPGANGICLGIPAADGSSLNTGCSSLPESEQGLLIVQRPSTGPVVYGLVPSNDSVTTTNKDGSTNSVTVNDNVFIDSSAAVRSIAVHAADGSVVRSMTVAKSATE